MPVKNWSRIAGATRIGLWCRANLRGTTRSAALHEVLVKDENAARGWRGLAGQVRRFVTKPSGIIESDERQRYTWFIGLSLYSLASSGLESIIYRHCVFILLILPRAARGPFGQVGNMGAYPAFGIVLRAVVSGIVSLRHGKLGRYQRGSQRFTITINVGH